MALSEPMEQDNWKVKTDIDDETGEYSKIPNNHIAVQLGQSSSFRWPGAKWAPDHQELLNWHMKNLILHVH